MGMVDGGSGACFWRDGRAASVLKYRKKGLGEFTAVQALGLLHDTEERWWRTLSPRLPLVSRHFLNELRRGWVRECDTLTKQGYALRDMLAGTVQERDGFIDANRVLVEVVDDLRGRLGMEESVDDLCRAMRAMRALAGERD